MRGLVPLFVLLTLALAAAGCGGESGPGSGGGSAETEAGTLAGDEEGQPPGLQNDPTYIEAGNICINLPIEQLAAQYAVEATPEAVSKAVAKDYPQADRKKAEQGCRDVLEEGGGPLP